MNVDDFALFCMFLRGDKLICYVHEYEFKVIVSMYKAFLLESLILSI